VPLADGVIVDSYAGLERDVYVVEGVPQGVAPRPVPKVGGPHVAGAGAAWRQVADSAEGRPTEQLQGGRLPKLLEQVVIRPVLHLIGRLVQQTVDGPAHVRRVRTHSGV
jgi:hypothetical protein